MSDLDPLDQTLRRVLHSTAQAQHPTTDPAVELTALRPRFRRARRRRTAAAVASVASVASVAAAVVLVVGVTSANHGPVHVISPAHSTSAPRTRPQSDASTTTMIVVAPPTTGPGATPGPTTSTVPARTSQTSISSNRSPGGPPSPTSTPAGLNSPTNRSTTTTTLATQSRSVPAPGGTVVVRYDSTVHILSIAPTVGWTVSETKQDDPTRIEVRFTKDGSSDQSRVEVRLQHGQLETTVS